MSELNIPSPILKKPKAMYELMDSDYLKSRQLELYRTALNQIETSGEIQDKTYHILKWYVSLFENLLSNDKLSLKIKSLIAIESPNACFHTLINNYSQEFFELYELPLLSHPSYIYKIINWSINERVSLHYPLKFYETLLFSDIYWASHYFHKYKPELFMERMAKYHEEHINSNPTSPLFLYLTNQIDSLDPYIDSIGQNYSLAFQTASLYPDKLSLEDLLFEASLEPQWAFHILKYLSDKVPEEIKSMSYSAIQYNPPWLIEYLNHINMFESDPHKAIDEIQESIETSGHPTSSDITEGILKKLKSK